MSVSAQDVRRRTAAGPAVRMGPIDFRGLLGLLIALGGIAAAQFIEGGQLTSLVQGTAFLIVVCGTIGAVMFQSPGDTFVQGVRMGRWIVAPPRSRGPYFVQSLARWSAVARRDGLLALESELQRAGDDNFVRNGLQMLIDGWSPERMREALHVEIDAYEERLRAGAAVWESAGGYAPTLGILGAVIGLIHVMEHLSDPTRLGAGIAIAFVATVYGVGLANLVFLPAAYKLRAISDNLVRERELVADGLVAVACGENPHRIEQRLSAYLA